MEELNTAAKQVGNELISLSNIHSQAMKSWSDILAQNPGSPTAKVGAGFVNNPQKQSTLEMVVDVLAPPNTPPVLRTWAIQVRTGTDQKTYVNNIQLSFTINPDAGKQLVSQSSTVTRENISQLLQAPETQLMSVTVSNEASGTAAQLTSGERYDFTTGELSQQSADMPAKISQALQTVLGKLKALPVTS